MLRQRRRQRCDEDDATLSTPSTSPFRLPRPPHLMMPRSYPQLHFLLFHLATTRSLPCPSPPIRLPTRLYFSIYVRVCTRAVVVLHLPTTGFCPSPLRLPLPTRSTPPTPGPHLTPLLSHRRSRPHALPPPLPLSFTRLQSRLLMSMHARSLSPASATTITTITFTRPESSSIGNSVIVMCYLARTIVCLHHPRP